ncbi:MAG TPA: hypothetical protein VM692_01270 [Gammaproteobacteria bacterium]|nr:hypothetical protein [Gammaproteobacteria bacterium]
MRTASSTLLALGCWWLAAAQAQETEQPPPAPDLDFLEYLGTWAEEDDEWLAIEEWQKDQAPDRDSDTQGSGTEKDDDDESE